MAAPLPPPVPIISAELDQRARHHANSLGEVRPGEQWRSAYAQVIAAEHPTLPHVHSCIAPAAWVSEPLNSWIRRLQRISCLEGACNCNPPDSNCAIKAYTINIAIPFMTTMQLVECLLTLRDDEKDGNIKEGERWLLTQLEAEVVHRRAPVDARQAYIVSDMARALDQRGVVPGVAAIIARMHIGPTHDLPFVHPRPLALHAVRARLLTILAAQPYNRELMRLLQDIG